MVKKKKSFLIPTTLVIALSTFLTSCSGDNGAKNNFYFSTQGYQPNVNIPFANLTNSPAPLSNFIPSSLTYLVTTTSSYFPSSNEASNNFNLNYKKNKFNSSNTNSVITNFNINNPNTLNSQQAISSFPNTTVAVAEQKINSLSSNAQALIGEGFYHIFEGPFVVTRINDINNNYKLKLDLTPLITDISKYPIATQIPSLGAFSGQGVTVAQIDGTYILPKSLKDQYKFYYQNPQTINITEIVGNNPNYPRLSGSENHGFSVGTIISGKRTSFANGLTPGVNHYIAELSNPPASIGNIFVDAYNQVHPAIITNSFSFPNANSDEYGVFNNIKQAISILQHVADAPLFIFAAGNINKYDYAYYLQHYANLNQNQKLKILTNLANTDELQPYNDGINSLEGIAYLIKNNPKLARNIIVVAGAVYDPSWSYRKSIYDLLIGNTKYPQYALFSPQEITSLKQEHKLPSALNITTTYQNKTLNLKDFVPAFSSLKCGVVANDCLVAGFDYKMRNAYNPDSSAQILYGTSFATPLVASVVAMIKQQFPWMTAENLKDTLLTTATDLGEPGVDPIYGWGLVNAANAVHGPAQFAFGNFIAYLDNRPKPPSIVLSNQKALLTKAFSSNTISNKLTTATTTSIQENINPTPNTINFNQAYNSFFINSISGKGGLVVYGNNKPTVPDNNFLFLTGDNSYQGSTFVNGGNLVLVSPATLGLSKISVNTEATLKSDTFVNPQGAFYVINASTGNLSSNGTTTLINATINGNLILDNNSKLNIGYVMNKPIIVAKNAKINGTLDVWTKNHNNGTITGNINILSSLPNSKIGNGLDRKFILLQTIHGTITGNFINTNIPSLSSALVNVKIGYARQNQNRSAIKSTQTSGIEIQDATKDFSLTNNKTTNNTLLLVQQSKNISTVTNSINKNLSFTDRKTLDTATAFVTLLNKQVQHKLASINSNPKISQTLTLQTNSIATLTSNTNTPLINNKNLHPKTLLNKSKTSIIDDSNKNIITMEQLRKLSLDQYKQFLFQQAGTIYFDLQSVTNQSNLQAIANFRNIFNLQSLQNQNNWLQLSNYSTQPIIKGYFNSVITETTWNKNNKNYQATNLTSHTLNSSISGKQILKGLTIGAYTQSLPYNFGIAFTHNLITWNEYLNSNFNNTSLLDQANYWNHSFALAQANSNNINFIIEKSFNQAYFLINTFATISKYHVVRSSLTLYDQKAKFISYTSGITGQGGYLVWGNATKGLIIDYGINWMIHHQKSFNETTSVQATASQALQFNAKASNTSETSINLGVKVFKSFMINDVPMQIDADLTTHYTAIKPNFSLKLTNGLTTAGIFDNFSLIKLATSYSIQITPSLNIKVSGAYTYNPDWKNLEAQATLTYKF